MFDMFSLKSAMIPASDFFGKRPELFVLLPNCWQQRLLHCFHKIRTINLILSVIQAAKS